MSKIDNPLGVAPFFNDKYRTTTKTEQPLNKPINSVNSAAFDNFSLNNQAAIGMKIVFQSVSAKFSSTHGFSDRVFNNPFENKLNNSKVEPIEESTSLFDFEKVAKTVMDFVSSSLHAAKGRGDSDEKLAEMLAQARSGVNQGIDEALGELKELNLLDDGLTEGIEKSRELISVGIDKLSEQLFPTTQLEDNKDNGLASDQVQKYSSDIGSSSSKSSDLTITTRDGDLVKISFSDYQAHQLTNNYSSESSDDATRALYQSSSTSYREINFSYSIEGELDEDEKSAISALIKDVNKLQKEFFNGNIEKAYEQVKKLGFDDEQLSSMSLDIQQQQTSKLSQSYTEVSNYKNEGIEQLNKQLKPILDFVEHFKQLREAADKLFANEEKENKGQFQQLLQSVFKAEFGDNDKMLKQINHFMEKLT